MQRGRKRKTIYDQANKGLPLTDDEGIDDLEGMVSSDEEVGLEEGDQGLDALIGDAFEEDDEEPLPAGTAEDRGAPLPSRAKQYRPESDDGTIVIHKCKHSCCSKHLLCLLFFLDRR